MTGLAVALGVNVVAALLSIAGRLVRPSAAWGGILVGTIIFWGATWRGYLILIAFFVIGVSVTKLGYRQKAARGLAEPNEGRRGSAHAFANGGVPALASIVALLWPESLPLVSVFIVGAFGAAISDTAGSEIGQLWGHHPISPRTFQRVEPGTPGAVSREGTLAALLAPALLATIALVVRFVSPWGALAGAVGGFLGGMIESVVGDADRFRTKGHMALNFGNTFLGGAAALVIALLLGNVS